MTDKTLAALIAHNEDVAARAEDEFNHLYGLLQTRQKYSRRPAYLRNGNFEFRIADQTGVPEYDGEFVEALLARFRTAGFDASIEKRDIEMVGWNTYLVLRGPGVAALAAIFK